MSGHDVAVVLLLVVGVFWLLTAAFLVYSFWRGTFREDW